MNVMQLIVIAAFSLYGISVQGQALDDAIRAVESGQVKAVAELLDRGVDVNTTAKSGHSLLMIASRMGHRDVVALLLARKANVRQRSAQGDTALLMASLLGDVEVIKLLLGGGADPNQPGWAPLHYAAFEGKAAAVQFLLEKGADKDAVAPNGYTALMLAARNGKTEAAKALLYADPDVNFRTDKGETALAIAKARNMTEVVELIRRAGGVE